VGPGEFGDGDRDGREQTDNMESARSIFPVLTSFDNGSGANIGGSVGLPFEPGEVVYEGLDVCGEDDGADGGNHVWRRGAETGIIMRLWMS